MGVENVSDLRDVWIKVTQAQIAGVEKRQTHVASEKLRTSIKHVDDLLTTLRGIFAQWGEDCDDSWVRFRQEQARADELKVKNEHLRTAGQALADIVECHCFELHGETCAFCEWRMVSK